MAGELAQEFGSVYALYDLAPPTHELIVLCLNPFLALHEAQRGAGCVLQGVERVLARV
jgi:hypothetical protein